MRVDLFDFDLPQERIALRPARPRDSARLLQVKGGEILTHYVDALKKQAGDKLTFDMPLVDSTQEKAEDEEKNDEES